MNLTYSGGRIDGPELNRRSGNDVEISRHHALAVNVFGRAIKGTIGEGSCNTPDRQLAGGRHFEVVNLNSVHVIEGPADGWGRVTLSRTSQDDFLTDGDGLVARRFEEDRALGQDVQVDHLEWRKAWIQMLANRKFYFLQLCKFSLTPILKRTILNFQNNKRLSVMLYSKTHRYVVYLTNDARYGISVLCHKCLAKLRWTQIIYLLITFLTNDQEGFCNNSWSMSTNKYIRLNPDLNDLFTKLKLEYLKVQVWWF